MFTNHFKYRLKQRTKIKDVDSFCERVLSEKHNIKKVDIYSKDLNSYPQIRNKLYRNPNQRVWIIDWENLYLFEENQYFKTIVGIKKYGKKIISGVDMVMKTKHHHT